MTHTFNTRARSADAASARRQAFVLYVHTLAQAGERARESASSRTLCLGQGQTHGCVAATRLHDDDYPNE